MSCNPIKKIDIQGHRGCRGLFPENSLPAFEKAIDLGVTTLELDIAITNDNEVVVSHEPYINPLICLDSKGEVIPDSMKMAYNLYKMTHKQIKEFDCGSKFHPTYPNQKKMKVYKPLLTEVYELAKKKKSNIKFNIEIKSEPIYYGIYTPHPRPYVKIVLDQIRASGMVENTNLQSFDLKILEEIKKQEPKMPVALLIEENEDIQTKLNLLSYQPEIISPYFKLLDKEMISDYQSNGFLVIPWTINEVSDMERMLIYQVDGIITDYPDILLELLSN